MASILISNPAGSSKRPGLAPINRCAPRQDYTEVAQKLEAQVVDPSLISAFWLGWPHQFERHVRFHFLEALFALRYSSKHSKLLSTSEKAAIPLSLILHLTKQEMPHVVVAHKLSSGWKTALFRVWRLYKRFTHVICVCRAQADYAVNKLGLPASSVDFIYDKVDHHFFQPIQAETENYILAVGKEQRDYKSLIQAVDGTGLRVVIVASSPWSNGRVQFKSADHVTVLSNLTYHELKLMYARARLVVVPLLDVDYAAGVNSVLEAMAMAKPLIVTRSQGITDYVVDNETGIDVTTQDVRGLRYCILSLWQKPGERDRLGANARQAVEEQMNLDIYVDRVVQIMRQVTASSTVAAPH
jgi:glycosyltransferase involved in cell wall biosynthesis